MTRDDVPAAFPTNSSPSRTSRASTASEAWPVWTRISNADAPAWAALVAKSARSECPDDPVGSMRAAARSRTTRPDTSPERCPRAAFAVTIDRAEHWSLGDAGDVEPTRDGGDRTPASSPERDVELSSRALLIGLRSTEGHDQLLTEGFDVGAIDCRRFGSPEPTREAEQQKRPISDRSDIVAHAVEHAEQVVSKQRLRLSSGDVRVRRMPPKRCAPLRRSVRAGSHRTAGRRSLRRGRCRRPRCGARSHRWPVRAVWCRAALPDAERKAQVGEQVCFRLVDEDGELRHLRSKSIGDGASPARGGLGVVLSEGRCDEGRDDPRSFSPACARPDLRLDRASRDATDVGLTDDGDGRFLRHSPRFPETPEAAAGTKAGDAQFDGSGPSSQSRSVAVASRRKNSPLLAPFGSGLGADLQLHQMHGSETDRLAQDIGIGALLHERTQARRRVGHRWLLDRVGSRKSDHEDAPTMTTSLVSYSTSRGTIRPNFTGQTSENLPKGKLSFHINT